MSMQDIIDGLFSSSPSPNKGNKWGSRAREALAAIDGNLDTLADPTCSYTDIADAPVGQAITPVTPTLGGGPAFEFQGTLPPGLVLDPHTGVISGIPTEELAVQTFTISVIGAAGDVDATLDINIEAPIVAVTYPVIKVPDGVLIPAGSFLPAVQGGKVGNGYVATDALPTGMTIDADTGEIAGTPSGGASGPDDHTITITNSIGAVTSEVSIEVTA